MSPGGSMMIVSHTVHPNPLDLLLLSHILLEVPGWSPSGAANSFNRKKDFTIV
jgi:hypothetical protein